MSPPTSTAGLSRYYIVTARRNYPALEAALATSGGRATLAPFEVQLLGVSGLTASVPLAQVQIVP